MLLLIDFALILGMFVLAFGLRVGWEVIDPRFLLSIIVPALTLVVALYTINGYVAGRAYDNGAYAIEHFVAVGFAYLLSLAVNQVLLIDALGGITSRAAGVIGFGLIGVGTLLARRELGAVVQKHVRSRTLCVLGDAAPARKLLWDLDEAGETRRVIAFISENSDEEFPENYEVHFAIDPIEAIRGVPDSCDEIVVASRFDKFDTKMVNALVARYLSGATIFEIDRFYEHRLNRIRLLSVSHSWLLDGELVLRRSIAWARIKRLFDVVGSALGLIMLAPMLIAIGALIVLETSGPVLFRQARMGRDGVPFTMLKFRTMPVGADSVGPYTAEKDARVTRVGKLIRGRRLDELPQLWNVLIGEMSLVGPRAESLDLVRVYEREIPFYHLRYVTRPGVTGLAQITQGYVSSSTAAIRKLEYDLYYVRHYNFVLDLGIMLRTLRVIARGEGR